MPFQITIASELESRVLLGFLTFDEVRVSDTEPLLQAEIERYGGEVRQRYAGVRSGEVPGAAEARTLYKALGIDPTKIRPSSESLVRRVLKGEALYQVNTLVDVINLCSLRAQLPFGLYDRARIEPPIVLRRGAEGEAYDGIRKGVVNVEGRPVLVDTLGPFGNPTSDSARTMITLTTRKALVTVYAPAGYSLPRLHGVLDATETTIARFCGGTRAERGVLPER